MSSVSILLLLCVLLSGCYETSQEFTVNPDGSGKMRVESVFVNQNIFDDNRPSDEILKSAIRKLLEETKGVEAWRDVSYTNLDDGRMSFKGTAYFRDLSAVEMPNYAALKFLWRKLGDNKMELILREHAQAPARKESQPAATREETAEKMRRERASFQRMKPLLAAMLAESRQDVRFHLPGEATGFNLFAREAPASFRVQLKMAAILRGAERLIMNDSWLESRLKSDAKPGSGLPSLDASLTELVFSNSGPMHVVIKGATRPLFHYESELASALKETGQLRGTLGMSDRPVLAAVPGGALKNLRVVGVRSAADLRGMGPAPEKPWSDFRPFQQSAGVSFALLADLPGSVVTVDGGQITTAMTRDGNSLLPVSDFTRKVKTTLSEDKSKVLLEVHLRQPQTSNVVLTQLVGHITCQVAAGTREVDLGITGLVEKAKGTALGAEVRFLGRSSGRQSRQLVLHLELPPEKLLAVWSVQEGSRTKLERKGHTGGNGAYDYVLESASSPGAGTTLSVSVFDGFEKCEFPFKVNNLSLPQVANPGN